MNFVPKFDAKRDPHAMPETKPIRVMVVDDSALMRKLIAEMFAHAPGFEMIGTARDGRDALEKARLLRPDVITLDVEMPNMNGIEFLEALMPEQPTPVVMVSSLTSEGAETTLACLQRGAVDFVQKPSGSISVDIARRETDIVEKVRAASHARVRVSARSTPGLHAAAKPAPLPKTEAGATRPGTIGQTAGTNPAPALLTPPGNRRNAPSKVTRPMDRKTALVMIASSTGGPAALHEVLPLLPADLNAAYLIVQHLPPGFTKSLADRMNSLCALAAREAKAGDVPERGAILIAPGGHHLELDARDRITLNDDPPLWGVRPAADVTMRAVAARFGGRVIGVVLTGMGRDGALGVKAIQGAGGVCLAQDEATCVVYGMPRAAYETGCVAQVVPLPRMADAIVERITALTGEKAREVAA